MDILLAAAVVVAAVVAWTAWEATMVARLARDTRPLPRRNAAVAGAHRLTVVGQGGLVALAAVAAGLVAVPLWWNVSAVAATSVGVAVTLLLVLAAAAVSLWAARRGHRPQDRRALLAVGATAAATEVLLRGFGLGLLETAGWPVTAAVLVTSLATGLLQAWRAPVGSRAFGFVVATLLGFGLGLLVLLTGSVLAAAALHVVVAVGSLGRTYPPRHRTPGCACGHDHSAAPAAGHVTTGGAGVTTAGAAAPAGAHAPAAGPAAPEVVDLDRAAGPGGPHAAGPGTGPGAVAPSAGAHAHGSHASCGTTCDHAGSRACAACPLSTARV